MRKPKDIIIYSDDRGKEPFTIWLQTIKDIKTRARIKQRLRRIEIGNLGDYKPVGEGVFELRLQFGPGYRVYYGEINNQLIVLLCGGDKPSQYDDIKKAKVYWKEYRSKHYES